MNKATRTINKITLAKKTFLVLVAQFLLLAPLFATLAVYAQTEVPTDNSGGRADPGANLSGGARSTDDTVQYHVDAIPQINTVLESAQNATQDVIFEVEENLAGEIVARNDVWQGLHKFWEEDIVSNLFHNIGELIGKWISELINGWIADTVQFLTGFLRVFVLNPNIAINGLGGQPGDDISPWVRQGADVMYGIAVDLLLLLFVLCIWKYWAEATWRGGGNLMGAVGRLIFTAALMIAWPTIYAFEIQITNEMIQTVFFNSSDQVAALDAAMAAAVKAGLVATTALLTNATAGVAGQAFGGVLGAGPGGLVLGTVGGVIAWVGLIIYLVLGGILIAELIYILVLKAIQTALLTAQYMFAPIFLVFFATPDTENVTAGFVRSFVEVSLWTFVWVGLLKVMTIIILSDYNPWGKILLAVGVLQLMIQVPSFLARAQISPMSDFISAGMVTGGLLKAGKALGDTLQNRGTQLAEAIGGKFTTGAARGPQQSTKADLNGLPSGVANQKLYNDIKKAGDGKLGAGTKPPKKGGDGDGGAKLDANGKPINPAGGKTGDSPTKKKDGKTGDPANAKKLNPIANEKKKQEGKKGSVSDALRGLNTAAKGSAITAGAAAAVAGMGAAGAFKKDADGKISHAATGVPLTADELKANASELAAQGLVPPTTGTEVETGKDGEEGVKSDATVKGKVLETGDKGKGGTDKPPAKKDDDKTSAAAKAGMAAAAGALGANAKNAGKTGDKTKADGGKGAEKQLNVPVDEKTKTSGKNKGEAGAVVVPPNQNAVDALTSGKDGKDGEGLASTEDVNGERLNVERDGEEGDSATAGTLKTNLTPGTKDGAGAGLKPSNKVVKAVAAALATGVTAKALNSGAKGDKIDATPAKPGGITAKGGNFRHADQATNQLKDATGAGVVEGKNLDAGAVGTDPKAEAQNVDLAAEAETDQKAIALAGAGVSPLIVAAMRNRAGGAKGASKDGKGQIIQGTGTGKDASAKGLDQTAPTLKTGGKVGGGTGVNTGTGADLNQGKIDTASTSKSIDGAGNTTVNNDTQITQETDVDTNVHGKIVPPAATTAIAAAALGMAARNLAGSGKGTKVEVKPIDAGKGANASGVSASPTTLRSPGQKGAGSTGADLNQGKLETPTGTTGKGLGTGHTTVNNDTSITQETDIETDLNGKIVPPAANNAIAAAALGLAARNLAGGGKGTKVEVKPIDSSKGTSGAGLSGNATTLKAQGGKSTGADLSSGKVDASAGATPKGLGASNQTTINNDTSITQETDVDANVHGKIVPPTIASAVAATGLGLAARNMGKSGQTGKLNTNVKPADGSKGTGTTAADISSATSSIKGQAVGGAGADGKGQGVITIDSATGQVIDNANSGAENIQAQASVDGTQTNDGKGGLNFNPALALVPPARAGASAMGQKEVKATIAPKLDGTQGNTGIPSIGDAKINATASASASANATTNANLDASSLNADGTQATTMDQANVSAEMLNASGQPVGTGSMDVKQQVGITPGLGANQQANATQNVQAELNQGTGAVNAGQLADARLTQNTNTGQPNAMANANVDANQVSNLDQENTFDPNVQISTDGTQLGANSTHTETVNAKIIPPQAGATAGSGQTVDVTGQGPTPPQGVGVVPGGFSAGGGGRGGSGGGGRVGGGGPGGPNGPDDGDTFATADGGEQSPYLNRYHATNENNPFENFQQAGYRMIPPRSIAGNIRLAQNTTLGPTTRADGKAELIGNGKGMTAHVRTGEGHNDQQVAMQMMAGGYAGLIGSDPAAYDAARSASVEAGLDQPKGMAERMAAGIMSYRGGSWSQTANAKQRFQLGMYDQAVQGSAAYVAGQSGNDYTQYLNDRYGPMTPEQQAMSAYVMTNSASPESAWNWAHIPATEALVRNSIPISGTSRAVAANLSVQKSPPWLVGAAVRGGMSYIESRAAQELPADVDPMVKDAWVGREAQLMSPAIANTNAALALELNEEAAANVDVVHQVANQVGAGAKQSDYVAAYKSIANLQNTARSFAPSMSGGGGGGTIRTSGGGGGTPQVDTQVLGGGGQAGGSGYVNSQNYDVEVVPDYNIGAGGEPNITPGMLNSANTPGGAPRMRTNVNVNQAGGNSGAGAPPLRHMRFESPVSMGSGSSSADDVQIGNFRGGSSAGHTVEQHVEAEILGTGGSSMNGIDENALNGNVQKWVAQYGSPEAAASSVFVSMSEAGFSHESMTNPQVAQVAMQVQANDPSMMEAAAIAVDRLGDDGASYENVVEVQTIMDADSRNTPHSIDKSTIQTARAIRGMSQQIKMENPQFGNISMPPTQRLMTQLSEHDDFVPREELQPGQYRPSVLDFLKEKFQRKHDEANGIYGDNDRSSRFA